MIWIPLSCHDLPIQAYLFSTIKLIVQLLYFFYCNISQFIAAAAAAKAQLAQVPPPEHLKFPVNDMQMSGLPQNEKVKRRRKRKVDTIDPNSNNVNSQPLQDGPPLKVVPHPVKYTSVAEAGPTDLEVCLDVFVLISVC